MRKCRLSPFRPIVLVAAAAACSSTPAASDAGNSDASIAPPPDAGTLDASNDAGAYDPVACAAWFSSVDASIPAPGGPGPGQRKALVEAHGGIRKELGKYIATWIPQGWEANEKRILMVALHGTGGYPEAEWNGWHSFLEPKGWGFIGVSYLSGDAYDDATTTWKRVRAALSDMNQACGTKLTVHLSGFSRGSAQTFPVTMLDRKDNGPINGSISHSGAWVIGGPLVPELQAVDGDAASMRGVRIWGWAGTADHTHGTAMTDEMTNALDWVKAHGGTTAPLYISQGLDHGDFLKDPAAVAAALAWLDTLEPR